MLDMTWSVFVKLAGSQGMSLPVVSIDWCHWPVAVPTVTFGAFGLKLLIGASGAKQILLALESTIAVV